MDVAAYIAGYSAADRSMIEFRSNGQQGPALWDGNVAFRRDVCLALLNGQSASDELIRDLYDAESQFSKAAWSVRHKVVVFLASELLRRGGPLNVWYYLECIWRAPDCYLSSLCVQLSPEERAAAVAEIAKLAAMTTGQEAERWQRVAHNLERSPSDKA